MYLLLYLPVVFIAMILYAQVNKLFLIGFPIFFLLAFFLYNLVWIWGLYAASSSQKTGVKGRRNAANGMQIIGVFLAILTILLWTGQPPILASLIEAIGLKPRILSGVTAFLALTATWFGFFQKRRVAKLPQAFVFSATDMTKWLNRWTQANGSIEKMLPPPTQLLSASNPQESINFQVTSYSFDRLVVCQNDAIAQMLIKNNFHFENNCAILSINGYPQPIFNTVMQMLRRNPDLTVFAFHDCSPDGVSLVHQLRTSPHWFQNFNVTIIDIGLLPRQVASARRSFFIRSSEKAAQAAAKLPVPVRQALSKDELAWLERGNFVELESLSPLQIIRVLNRSIAKGQLVEEEGRTDLVFVDNNHDSAFYAAESFG